MEMGPVRESVIFIFQLFQLRIAACRCLADVPPREDRHIHLSRPCICNKVTAVTARLIFTLCLFWWMGTDLISAATLLSSNQLVFVNVDHAPMGACSTMA